MPDTATTRVTTDTAQPTSAAEIIPDCAVPSDRTQALSPDRHCSARAIPEQRREPREAVPSATCSVVVTGSTAHAEGTTPSPRSSSVTKRKWSPPSASSPSGFQVSSCFKRMKGRQPGLSMGRSDEACEVSARRWKKRVSFSADVESSPTGPSEGE